MSTEEPCKLGRDNKDRWSPKTQLEAFCYQLHDDISILHQLAHTKDVKAQRNAIEILQMRLDLAVKVLEKK